MAHLGINEGSLEIYMGPMFCGKTEAEIKHYKQIYEILYKDKLREIVETHQISENEAKEYLNSDISENNLPIIAVNYDRDTRYGKNKIISHNKLFIDCISLHLLNDLLEEKMLENIKYIFIDEAQFFTDLKEVVLKLVENYNIHVIISGLDSDFKREKFGNIWDLIPHANKVTKLSGICRNEIEIEPNLYMKGDKRNFRICNNPTLFTHRITKEKEQEVIGVNNYIAVCRSCYKKLNPEKIMELS